MNKLKPLHIARDFAVDCAGRFGLRSTWRCRRCTHRATVDTCARGLMRAGAAHVVVLVFTRVVAALPTTI